MPNNIFNDPNIILPKKIKNSDNLNSDHILEFKKLIKKVLSELDIEEHSITLSQ